MRAFLALRKAGAQFSMHDVGMFTKEGWKDSILQFSGAGKVPILVDGASTIHETMAICETLAERYSEAHLWPEDAALRARARAISSEMATGFHTVRSMMPTNLRGIAANTPKGDQLDQEIRRIFEIWEASLSTSTGDFLFGDFSIADCMYTPVVSRFRTYGVELPSFAQKYAAAILAHPAVQELEGLAQDTEAVPHYDEYLK
jgi:glutathione S-transferase